MTRFFRFLPGVLLAAVLPMAATGCNSKDKGSSSSASAGMAGPQKRQAPVLGKVVLETVDVPLIGKMLVPKGSKPHHMSKSAGHYSLDLSANGMVSLDIDYETVGTSKSLKDAKFTSEIAGGKSTLVSAKTLPNGLHIVERSRASDKLIWVFAVLPKGYLKCFAPAKHLEDCRKIAKSVPMPDK